MEAATEDDSDSYNSDDDVVDESMAVSSLTASLMPVSYKIKYEEVNRLYDLPSSDALLVQDKLQVQVNQNFDYDQFTRFKDDPSMFSSNKSVAITLKSCLARFSVEEQLDKFNEWYCPDCKNHVQAFKTMDLYRLPRVMVIQLKRFEYEEGQSFYGQRSTIRNKITSLVDFLITGLDLSDVAKGPQDTPPVYDLFAISNHHGGLGGGHYTAYAKNFHNGKWYNFNDAMVNEVNESEIVTSSAYVLFYKRRENSDEEEFDITKDIEEADTSATAAPVPATSAAAPSVSADLLITSGPV